MWPEVAFYIKKLIMSSGKFLVSLGIAFGLFYKVLLPLLKKYPKLGHKRLGFQAANSMILLFLGGMWGYFLVLMP